MFGAVLFIERRMRDRPNGLLIAAAAATWGMARFFDQYFWLGTPGHLDAVKVAGLALSLVGWTTAAYLLVRRRVSVGRRNLESLARQHAQTPDP